MAISQEQFNAYIYAHPANVKPSHGFEVSYNHHSSVCGAAYSAQEAKDMCEYYVQYYKDLGYNIRSATVETLCESCEGGLVKKVSPSGRKVKYVTCKKCKGQPVVSSYQVEY